MTPFFGEMIGTGLLVFFGQTVVSNVLLAKSKGQNSGWIVISFGWAMAVFIGVFVSASASKSHLNPAVTIAFAVLNKIPLSLVPTYLAAQFLGAMIGSTVAWVCYRGHFGPTHDADLKLAVFCTAPAIRNYADNVVTETIATFTLVLGAIIYCFPLQQPGRPGRTARGAACTRNRAWTRRPNRVRHQSRPGPGTAHHARITSDPR